MANPFRLYKDEDGFARANAEIRKAADKLILTIEKHSKVGAANTASLDAIYDYIVHSVRI